MTPYRPSCWACRDSSSTFYTSCSGCQARKAHIFETQRRAQLVPPLHQRDVEAADSMIRPLEPGPQR